MPRVGRGHVSSVQSNRHLAMADSVRGELRDDSSPRRCMLFVCTHNAAGSEIAAN